jgi:hypothetical protein
VLVGKPYERPIKAKQWRYFLSVLAAKTPLCCIFEQSSAIKESKFGFLNHSFHALDAIVFFTLERSIAKTSGTQQYWNTRGMDMQESGNK